MVASLQMNGNSKKSEIEELKERIRKWKNRLRQSSE
jgi:hypothetical protein